ncbi:MAG: hypothetical protein J6X55_03165 [Victivallales bacterium]|nr:hypothetical protein [Victivallales bacterium]
MENLESSSSLKSVLLAIDVGMKAGFAWFDGKGMLIRARSTRFANRAMLKRALPSIWAEISGVNQVVLEGQGDIADIFKKSAMRVSLPVQQFSAEEWRKDMLLVRERRTGRQAKATAETLALKIARECGNSPKCVYDDDAAEAVLFGLWYARYHVVKE